MIHNIYGQRRDRGRTEEGQRRDRGGTEEGQRRDRGEMRETDNKLRSIFLSVVGVYVVRTSSLNDKHSCQLFRKASSLVLLSSSVSTANLSCLLDLLQS